VEREAGQVRDGVAAQPRAGQDPQGRVLADALIDKFEEARNLGVDESLNQAREKHTVAHQHWEWWTASNGHAFHNPEAPPRRSRSRDDVAGRHQAAGRRDGREAQGPVALPLVAVVLYFTVGKPDALTDDPPAPVGEAVKGDFIEQLQSHLSRQPRDGRGWVLLARAQADRNEFKAAADAYQKALTVSEKVAKDPAVLCEYADALGMTQGGSLAGRPAELIAKALSINPAHPAGLEMAGSLAYEEGRYADAVRYWKALLADLTPGSERHRDLSTAVARAERKAAVALPR
jgi:tetratricopeptide (TPR) repeat protein